MGCCLKNGYEAIFFHNICTRIYNDIFIVRHFLSILKAAIAQCLKRSHKLESDWEDRERTLQDPADNKREYFFSLNGDMCASFMISIRG